MTDAINDFPIQLLNNLPIQLLDFSEVPRPPEPTPLATVPLPVDMNSVGPVSVIVELLIGSLDYAYLLRYRQGEVAAIPSGGFDDSPIAPDRIGNLPIAQLFDEYYYLNENPDVAAAIAEGTLSSGYDHFITTGLFEGRDPSVLYVEETYLAENTDVRQAVEDGIFSSGLEHFLMFGHQENRSPSDRFNQDDYLTKNPDVAAAVEDGLLQSAFEHYIKFGADEENRLPDVSILFYDTFASVPNPGSLYNEAFYLRTNADVAAAVQNGQFIDGFDHFVQFGQYELRNPSQELNQADYLMGNADVKLAIDAGLIESGFDHYVQFGRFESRFPFPTFNSDASQ